MEYPTIHIKMGLFSTQKCPFHPKKKDLLGSSFIIATKHSYLVTLITGRQGASTAAELLKYNNIVHALVSDKFSSRAKTLEILGCILFEGTLDDKSSIEPALRGATDIFLNLRPAHHDPEAEVRQTKNVLEVAGSVNTVTSIVVSTALKTGQHEQYLSRDPNYAMAGFYQSKKAIKDAVRASHIRYKTFLHPGWLMLNYLEPLWRFHYPSTYQHEHLLEVTYPAGTAAAHFDPADVGKFAAAAFLNPEKFDGHEIELGNEQLTIEEVARTIENVTGVKMKTMHLVRDEDLERAKAIYTFGLWKWALKEGHFLVDPRDLDKYGIRLATFEEFCRREGNSLKEALHAVKSKSY